MQAITQPFSEIPTGVLNHIILNLIGERNIIQFKAFIFNIELLVSILFPIFDELLKIPEINVFLSPLSGGMAPEKIPLTHKKVL